MEQANKYVYHELHLFTASVVKFHDKIGNVSIENLKSKSVTL